MPNNTRLYWLHCLAPTHIGTGRGVGYIDLPVYREKITNWPAFPGSGFKGVWADHYHNQAKITLRDRANNEKLKAAFGLADDSAGNSSQAGALIPTDARLVCLPIRSFRGTFAWGTSKLALHLLHRDLTLIPFPIIPALPVDVPENHVHLPTASVLKEGSRVYFEDLDFQATDNAANVQAWGQWIAEKVFPGDEGRQWQAEFLQRFAVLPDVVFDYLTETATEVVTRVRIDDDTKTVAEGQLWTEEALPAESILAGLISCDRVYNGKGAITSRMLLDEYATNALTLQIGGKASVGRGRVRCLFTT
jgi:CRISPR-associated protein Cmr4